MTSVLKEKNVRSSGPASRRNGLFNRYRATWSAAWKTRHQNDPRDGTLGYVEFMPAALELQDKPPHPAPRFVAWTAILFTAFALVWATVGRIDVVAVASGKVIPSGKTKAIRVKESAEVKAIHVAEGQAVKAGQLLIELDPTSADADVARIRSDLIGAKIDQARASAMLKAIDDSSRPKLKPSSIADASEDQVAAAGRWLDGQYLEFRSSLQLVDAEIDQRQADVMTARTQLNSFAMALPIAERLSSDYERLLAKQFISRHAYLEKEQARLELVRQIAYQRAAVTQTAAAKREAEKRKESTVAQARRAMLDLLQQSELKAEALVQELSKARYQEELTTIESPVDGTVQQLAVHTVGGVVAPGQDLLLVVPSNEPVEVEAMLENKDVGFVHPGQPVTVKIETFTYTKYGVLEGEVLSVSGDAIEDQKKGLVYSAKIRLVHDDVNVNGKQVRLQPGMAVTAEVKTDDRRIISYFLTPLQQYASESIRER